MANIQEIRKDHPKAGLKWTAEEDNYLKQSYEEYRAQRGNFNAYVGKISKELGRAIGGLKARLAKYFDDVPGWDYARDKYRAEALQKATEELFTLERSQQLKSEYENYLQGKRETYVSFLKRMSGLFEGVKSEHINQRITELCGRVEKYRRDDINPFGRDRSAGCCASSVR